MNIEQELRECAAVHSALMQWLQSQEVTPKIGAIVMTRSAGLVVGNNAPNQKELEKGIKIHCDLLADAAREQFKERGGQ